MDKQTERIDLYLTGKLSEKERVDFELAIENDEALASSVRLQQKATELLEAGAWLSTKERITELNSEKRESSSVRLFLRLAAVFIGLVFLGLGYKSYQLTDQQLHAEYFTAYPDRISVMGGSDPELGMLMNLYNQEQYTEAVNAFKKYRQKGKGNDLLVLYETISLQKIGNGSAAVELMLNHSIQEESLREVFAWQLIMAHLSIGNNKEALELVNEYDELEYDYQRENVRSLKEDLTSFWKL